MDIIPYGDHALLVVFENKINLEINQKVTSLASALKEHKPIGFKYCILAYCSLTVVYDPLVTTFHTLKSQVQSLEISPKSEHLVVGRTVNIPICYHENHAPDLKTFAASKSKSVEEVISIHSSKVYHVYMLGFLPGFAYLGKTDESIKADRLTTPRLKVPTGSVGLAGFQTAIYPYESPGGWQLIGQTPIKPMDPTSENPFLFKIGDKVKFRQIEKEEYKSIEVEIILNSFNSECLIDVGN